MNTLIRLIALVLVPLALWSIFRGTPQIILALMSPDDPRQVSHGYAERLFDGVLPFDEVLSSRYSASAPEESCQHVFVRLGVNAPSAPPRAALRHNRDLRFGGLWRPTPLAFADTAALEPVERCVAYVGRSLSAEIGRVLREPGAQYYRDLTDGTLHLYAPAARLAGRVRIASEGRP
ncbi:MAG: hypothetical protein WBC03_04470 [Albidovulum sp.]